MAGPWHTAYAAAQTVTDPDFWKGTEGRADTVYRFFYDQSPQPIPSEYDPVLEAEQHIRAEQAALPPTSSEAKSIWRRGWEVIKGARLAPAVRVLGEVGLGVSTAEVGWKIGSGINAKLLHLGLPGSDDPTALNPRLKFKTAGTVLHPSHVMPYDGWVWVFDTACCNEINHWFEYTDPLADKCSHFVVEPPQDWGEIFRTVGSSECWRGWFEDPETAPTNTLSAIAPEDELVAPGPIEDYYDQPYVYQAPAPAAPPRTTVEEGIEQDLSAPENELLTQWLNYQLGSPGERDPVDDGVNVPRPELAPGKQGEAFLQTLEELGLNNVRIKVLSDPDLDPAYDEGAVVEVSPPPGTAVHPEDKITVTVNRTGNRANNGECDRGDHQDPGGADPFLLLDTFVGRDPDQAMASTDVPFRWGDTWGYRHIATKHGWDGSQDRSDTQAALFDPAPAPDMPGSYQFYFFYLGPNRIPCTRRAIARFDLNPGEPAVRGIINSFAYPGWYRQSDFPQQPD